jgi:septum formation protein
LPSPKLILASASPRRQQLLTEAGYTFTIDPPDLEETFPTGMLPSDVARHLAEQKCKLIAARYPDAVVLAADTVVAFGDKILGKPKDAADARKMLQLLSGTTHLVITGVCVIHLEESHQRLIRVMSAVKMRPLSPTEIDRYIATNDWQGKAGGYGIQDADNFPSDLPHKTPFVIKQAGSKTNIVGLPMSVTKQLLTEAQIHPTKPS